MNSAKLNALLAAGLITLEQHQAAAASINPAGLVTELPQLQLTAPGSIHLDVDENDPPEWDGVLRGTVTAYGQLIPSHGMILEPGCLTPRQPLSANKLMRDHDHGQPVGYMLEVDPAGEEASFQIATGERGRVQQEVIDKLRDGFSVGFTTLEYDIDDDWIFHVRAADWYETSLCAVPAVAGAGVTSVAAALATLRKENRTMNRAQLAAALAAGTITQEQHDAALAALEATELAASPPAPANVPVEVAAGPELQVQQPAPIHTAPRALNLQGAIQRVSSAFNTMDRNQIQLAISDVLPADDPSNAWLREDWMGELWRANDYTRNWIDAWGVPEQMTNFYGKGWRWVDEPEVDEYAGDKAEVPSNDILNAPDTFTGFRIAAGWDVDRVFEDFADPDFTASFWAAAMRDYKRKSNIGIRTRTLAAATAPGAIVAGSGGTATVATGGVTALLKQVVRDVRAKGGRVNRIFLGDTQFGLLEDLPTDNLPLWLKSATVGLDIAEGSADIGTLRILNDSALAADQVVAFDNRAAKVKEKSPLQLKAQNIAHGGIDLGFFGYLRFDDHDNRVIIKRTYGEVLPV